MLTTGTPQLEIQLKIMTTRSRILHPVPAICFAGLLIFLLPLAALAAPEEIQVYLDEFADKGKVGLDLHTTYVASTRTANKEAPFHQLRVTPELSYGLSEHFETAAYFLTNRANAGNLQTDGVKVRLRWRPIVPTEETVWYAALNIELGRLARRFNPDGSNGEIKGILVWKSASWIAGLNLNIDRPLRRHTLQPTTTELDSKLSYKVSDRLKIGVENYSFLGPLHGRAPDIIPNRATFLATDFSISKWDINFGIGRVSGEIPDKVVIKAIIGVPL